MLIPAFIQEHPVETVLAGALLLGMLFGGADHHAVDVAKAQQSPKIEIAQKL